MTFSESSADRGQGGLRRERHSGLRFKYPGLCYIVVKWQSSNFVQDSNVLSRKKKKRRKNTNTYFYVCITCTQKEGMVEGRLGSESVFQTPEVTSAISSPRVGVGRLSPERGPAWRTSPAAGGARTCHTGMCTVWCHPGNSPRGPAARGEEKGVTRWLSRTGVGGATLPGSALGSASAPASWQAGTRATDPFAVPHLWLVPGAFTKVPGIPRSGDDSDPG